MHKFPGGLTARVTPVPIPNTEVKPRRADDTALETTRERRSPPGLKLRGRIRQGECGLFVFAPRLLPQVNFMRGSVAFAEKVRADGSAIVPSAVSAPEIRALMSFS